MSPETVDIIRRLIVLEEGRKSDLANTGDRADEILRRLTLLEGAVSNLTDRTSRHLMVATCLKGGQVALQWGSAGGGVVATVILIGKLLGFW